MESSFNLNLTRKWRSKTFDAIIGQEVAIRILKNSLFLDQIFPVYLFSGQRGCGKTSTARVFTAALNCTDLVLFRKSPKVTQIPCLKCASCLAVADGKHPDFIEIDAASHTGVDSIRQLIETAYFLPSLGVKKVYLIDEVHMLSRAAFNALLKILEEPPKNVVFILATTDLHKVIETIRSRCFQLFFGPPNHEVLVDYLAKVCEQENISAESSALSILAREAEGSVRDAMNLLDQVRFAEAKVTQENVIRILGYVSDTQLLKLMELMFEQDHRLPGFLRELNLSRCNIDFVWRRFGELLKYILYAKYGLELSDSPELKPLVFDLANKFELEKMTNFLGVFLGQEQFLLKTNHKALVLELFFLRGLGGKKLIANDGGIISQNVKSEKIIDALASFTDQEIRVAPGLDRWQQMLGLVSQCGDPFLSSIFKQAKFTATGTDQKVRIEFDEQKRFLGEMVTEKIELWRGYLRQVFGEKAELEIVFSETEPKPTSEPISSGTSEATARVIENKKITVSKSNLGRPLDVSDRAQWPLANSILEAFPGQVYEVTE